MQATGLTVHMAVLERNEAVIIEKVEAPGLLKFATWIGRRLDVNCTGVGKALIAFLPEDEFDRHIRTKGFAKHNERTITSINKLKRELARARVLGYAFDDEEDEIGVRCIGAPIFDVSTKPVAAISVAGTTGQIPAERIEALADAVKQAATAVSLRLGNRAGADGLILTRRLLSYTSRMAFLAGRIARISRKPSRTLPPQGEIVVVIDARLDLS